MTHFKTILVWIASLWFTDVNTALRSRCITKWLSLIGKYIRTKGLVWTIKRIKLIRLITTRYLSGQPLYRVDSLIGLSLGFPKAIWFIKELVDSGRPNELRFILTLLTISRAITCEAQPNYESITNESTAKFTTIDPEFVTKFVTDFGLSLFRPVWSRTIFFFTMKGGPLGHPILTAIHAIKYYKGPMWAAIVAIVGLDGAGYLKDLWMKYSPVLKWDQVSTRLSNLTKHGYTGEPGVRRLSVVQDPELKARLVGIVDYFSQVVLDPLAKQLFDLLKLIPQDRTFTQDPHITRSEGEKYHSLDLSNATDRFPLDLQKQLLGEILGSVFAHAWGVLMTYNEFATPSGHSVRYAVGQPIGARSSWPMFTLSHHMAVQYAAYLVGKYPFKDYILLGDDIVITNDTVAGSYVQLMTNLGVEISNHKSHVSETTYEFAKRWFHNGLEVTGFPVNSIKSTLKTPLELYSAVLTQFDRGLVPYHFTGSVDCVVSLYSQLGWNSKKLRAVRALLASFKFTLRNLRNFNPDEVRNFLATYTSSNEEYYVIPAGEKMLESELSRVSSTVLSGMVIGLTYKLSRYQAKLDSMITSMLDLEGVESFDSYDWPLRDSIYMGIQGLLEVAEKIDVWKDLISLLETTTVVDLDQLAKKQRKSVVILYRLSTFGKALKAQLRFDPGETANINQNFRVKKAMLDLGRGFEKASEPR